MSDPLSDPVSDDVLVATQGPVARLRLNRPQAIHALTPGMCDTMSQALLGWRDDPEIKAVVIDHAQGRGFCAGGDVVMAARSGAGDGADARAFFRSEYRLNHLLFTYPKPTVALMDGITMGGGVGIALPCTYRVATENTRLAMPETGIGLFPDVGGGWYLSRLPGRVGQFMVLTGARLDAAECHYLGLATHYVPHSSLEELVERITKMPERLNGVLGAAAVSSPQAKIAGNLATITRAFAPDELEEVEAALDADGSDWASSELATIRCKSPLSCKVSLRLLAEGATRRSFAEEMAAEYALAGRVVRTHDFLEGVRALLIDKDGSPKWDPSSAAAVTDDMLDALFEPLPEDQRWTPFPGTGEPT